MEETLCTHTEIKTAQPNIDKKAMYNLYTLESGAEDSEFDINLGLNMRPYLKILMDG